ncbi:protein adenylyltransferase SelO [Roseomonas xinghualingensis]|uniref:protein adenylyltransferase SelO n=1 Tax=Roseomonas xinghualingensis TaxID=2986475 RepID=UPI0021F1FE20|nr:YdiU family protein [Roseomonas sp. SXEYE001]MCV4208760.1 YdiU family protein [Roseomonas sp. SXEYE001]
MSILDTGTLQAARQGEAIRFPFDNSYARLPDRFRARLDPTPVAAPRLLKLNTALARRLGLDPAALATPEGVEILAGNRIAEGSEPIAAAYAGHQFGNFVPQLGDGRAILLGEVVAPDGQRFDIQLKGSGRTPFSRGGDGRAAMGPVLREYLVSEAMAALGIPTTRALAAVATGQEVRRETPLPGAVLTRVASSHIRVGTFQFFAARGDVEALRILADHAIARHDPGAANAPNPYRALLEGVVARQASLVASWMLIGFIHGVMNTDNTSISGETIDYGPCAFMDAYDPATVFSSIDQMGRYAYGNQPRIMQWNLARLAEAMLPLIGDSEEAALAAANEALGGFAPAFEATYLAGLRAKIGLPGDSMGDVALAGELLKAMAENGADFTLTFRRLCSAAEDEAADARVRGLFADPAAYDAWAVRWRARLVEAGGDPAARAAAMRAVNPAVIPRNQKVEAALEAAIQRGDLGPFEALLDSLSRPYEDQPGADEPPAPAGAPYITFCGT